MHQLFEITDLRKYFPITKGLLRRQTGFVKAVDDICFSVKKGETLGIVGESGSGKTTLARLMLKLITPTNGSINFENKNISSLKKKELMDFRRKVQIVFQDPHSSLNPRLTVASTIGEGLIIHKLVKNKKERKDRIAELLENVGLKPDHMNRYPHEFSGGQRQRIGIARALSVNPEVIIADEPVSSLDVSVQAQILNLLSGLQQKFNLTYIFIAHDLRVVEYISTRIIVMYRGKIVEMAEGEELYKNPLHPYTKLLLDSIPKLDPNQRGFPKLANIESIHSQDNGCRYLPRCNKSTAACAEKEPLLKKISSGHIHSSHYAACDII